MAAALALTAAAAAGGVAWATVAAPGMLGGPATSGKSAVGSVFKSNTGCKNWEAMTLQMITRGPYTDSQGCQQACDRTEKCLSYCVKQVGLSDEAPACFLFTGFCDEKEDPFWSVGYTLRSTLAPRLFEYTGCRNWASLLVDKSHKTSAVLCEEWCYRYPFGCSSFNFAPTGSQAGECYLFRGECHLEPSRGWDLYLIPNDTVRAPPADVKSDAVEVEWYKWGRLGNQIYSLMNALLFAEGTGRQFVCFEDDGGQGHIRNLFWIPFRPACLPVETRSLATNTSLHCDQSHSSLRSGDFFSGFVGCQFHLGEARRVIQKYIVPLASAQLQASCAEAAETMSSFDGLTIHMRSGDLMDSTGQPGAAFAPCAFYDFVISQGSFKRVLIVTEPDRSHPCIAHLMDQADAIEVAVQSGSVAQDGCTLKHARHLAGGAISSTFAIGFGILMNKNLNTYYHSFMNFGPLANGYGTFKPCSQAGQSRILFHRVSSPYKPGPFDENGPIGRDISQEERMNFITKTTSFDISIHSEVCFE